MPASSAPNKPRTHEDPGASHRLAMCSLAVADEPGVGVTACEVERGGVSYTVDSLQAIDDEHPDFELTLILGADTARTLPRWREPARLLALAGLAVARREGTSEREVRRALGELHPAPRVQFLELGEMPVSSSLVRERVAKGLPVLELVGPRVAGYIAERHLYEARARVADGGVA
jgi:nicotinate-nucleotide adenylyltransferase